MDLTTLTDADLDQLRRDVIIEQERRATVEQAPAQADAISRRYLQAVGRLPDRPDGPPAEWVQPTAAHEAYPQDAAVLRGGKKYVSEQRANMDEPGVSPDWRPST